MEKINIGKSFQELAEKIRADYPNIDLYFFADDHIRAHRIVIMPLPNLIMLSKSIEADIMQILLERKKKEVMSTSDKQL